MRTPAKTKLTPRSLTETILSLCATGRFGVREAIAAASGKKTRPTRHQRPSGNKG